jgi:hypothetical protein
MPYILIIIIVAVITIITVTVVLLTKHSKSSSTPIPIRPSTTLIPITTTPPPTTPIIPVYGQSRPIILKEYNSNNNIDISSSGTLRFVQNSSIPSSFVFVQVTNASCNNYLLNVSGTLYGVLAPSGTGNPIYLTSTNQTGSGWYFSFSQAPANPLDPTDTSLLYLNVINNAGASNYVIFSGQNIVYANIPQAIGSENSYWPYIDTGLQTKYSLSCLESCNACLF